MRRCVVNRRPRAMVALGIVSREYVCDPLLQRDRRGRPISSEQQIRTAGRGRERRHQRAAPDRQKCSALHNVASDPASIIPDDLNLDLAYVSSMLAASVSSGSRASPYAIDGGLSISAMPRLRPRMRGDAICRVGPTTDIAKRRNFTEPRVFSHMISPRETLEHHAQPRM